MYLLGTTAQKFLNLTLPLSPRNVCAEQIIAGRVTFFRTEGVTRELPGACLPRQTQRVRSPGSQPKLRGKLYSKG